MSTERTSRTALGPRFREDVPDRRPNVVRPLPDFVVAPGRQPRCLFREQGTEGRSAMGVGPLEPVKSNENGCRPSRTGEHREVRRPPGEGCRTDLEPAAFQELAEEGGVGGPPGVGLQAARLRVELEGAHFGDQDAKVLDPGHFTNRQVDGAQSHARDRSRNIGTPFREHPEYVPEVRPASLVDWSALRTHAVECPVAAA